MTGPLTYPPEIVIESSVELPPEYDLPTLGIGVEVGCELAMVVIELVIGLLDGLS